MKRTIFILPALVFTVFLSELLAAGTGEAEQIRLERVHQLDKPGVVQPIEEYIKRICRCRGITGPDADDICQEVLTRFLERGIKYQEEPKPGAILNCILRGEINRYYKSLNNPQGKHQELTEMHHWLPTWDELKIEREEEEQLVHDALHSLPEHHRKLLASRYLVGKSQEEVAQEFGLSREAIAKRQQKALEAMRQALKERARTRPIRPRR